MWFEDLSPCTYFPVDAKLVAVGWLERGKPYSTGTADRRLYGALVEMRKNPWQPFACAGLHERDLCRFESEVRGSANLFIPADGTIYVCPELIVHYMNAHGYAPPEVFCRAVLACPPMRSMQYLKAIKECGGARLLRPSGGEVQPFAALDRGRGTLTVIRMVVGAAAASERHYVICSKRGERV